MKQDLTPNVYCSFCGKSIDECKCRVLNEVETKVAEPTETKQS